MLLFISLFYLALQFENSLGECNQYGIIEFNDFNRSSEIIGCEKSYFNIIINVPEIVDFEPNYVLRITDQNSDTAILYWENVQPHLNFSIHSESNKVSFQVEKSDELSDLFVPFFGYYTERKFINGNSGNSTPGIQSNGSINYDNIRPNSEVSYTLKGYGDYQLFKASWNFPKNLGYATLEHNGRTVIFTSPKIDDLKVR